MNENLFINTLLCLPFISICNLVLTKKMRESFSMSDMFIAINPIISQIIVRNSVCFHGYRLICCCSQTALHKQCSYERKVFQISKQLFSWWLHQFFGAISLTAKRTFQPHIWIPCMQALSALPAAQAAPCGEPLGASRNSTNPQNSTLNGNRLHLSVFHQILRQYLRFRSICRAHLCTCCVFFTRTCCQCH